MQGYTAIMAANRSPFPGMDPWLERHWGDLHHRWVQYACDQLADQLPTGLFAAVEETVYVVEGGADAGRARPDVAVFDGASSVGNPTHTMGNAIDVADPVRIRLADPPVSFGHIEIRALGGSEPLVTAIELVSPTNKVDRRGRRAYLAKRERYHDAGAHVVEVDLIRAGERLVDVPWSQVDPEQVATYAAAVRRAPIRDAELELEYYPLSLRQRLPNIRIPLRATDADAILDLQRPIDRAYEMGRYGYRLDYTRPPEPPLSPEDAAWATQVLATRGVPCT